MVLQWKKCIRLKKGRPKCKGVIEKPKEYGNIYSNL